MRVNRPPGPPLAISIIVLVAGFITAVTGGIGAAVSVVHDLGTVYKLPAYVSRHLQPGAYDVYQSRPATMTPVDVTVRAPDGNDIPTRPADRTTIDFGDTYEAVVEFTVESPGDYFLIIAGPGVGGDSIIIGRAHGGLLHTPAAWLITLGAGGLGAVIGLVLLIVGISRRDRVERQLRLAAVPSGPILVPPGWYPDPGGTARYRWWDGARWTNHTG